MRFDRGFRTIAGRKLEWLHRLLSTPLHQVGDAEEEQSGRLLRVGREHLAGNMLRLARPPLREGGRTATQGILLRHRHVASLIERRVRLLLGIWRGSWPDSSAGIMVLGPIIVIITYIRWE